MKITDKALNIYKKTAILEAYVRAGWEVRISLSREGIGDDDFIVAYNLNIKTPSRLYPWFNNNSEIFSRKDIKSYESAVGLALEEIRSILSEFNKIIVEIKAETEKINSTFDALMKIENREENQN